LFVAGLLVAPVVPNAVAQDATPTSEEELREELRGVTIELLGVALGVVPPSPAVLNVIRISLEPDVALPSDPSDPSLAMVLIESGELTIDFDAPFSVTRAGAFASVQATAEARGEFDLPEETIPAGQTVTLGVGDVAYFPPNSGGEIRNDGNDGTEPTVSLAFVISSSEGFSGDQATPVT